MKRSCPFLILGFVVASACSNPQPGPDKTLGGAVLGAGWGAGAGAVVGNQVSTPGRGAAVGAGVGAVSGMLSGAGYDLGEGAMLEQERQLDAIKAQNAANTQTLAIMQDRLDRAVSLRTGSGIYQVFFDPDATSLRSGAIADLEVIAEQLKQDPRALVINVVGHADDGGSPEYNDRLSEARARQVSAYLAARGISSDQIVVRSFGSKRPIASNNTPEGRQLNRRVDLYAGRS